MNMTMPWIFSACILALLALTSLIVINLKTKMPVLDSGIPTACHSFLKRIRQSRVLTKNSARNARTAGLIVIRSGLLLGMTPTAILIYKSTKNDDKIIKALSAMSILLSHRLNQLLVEPLLDEYRAEMGENPKPTTSAIIKARLIRDLANNLIVMFLEWMAKQRR